jgi:hypothetical protein
MKKVIRLTESDLMRIVKRVIKESDEPRFGNINVGAIKDFKADSEDDVDNFLENVFPNKETYIFDFDNFYHNGGELFAKFYNVLKDNLINLYKKDAEEYKWFKDADEIDYSEFDPWDYLDNWSWNTNRQNKDSWGIKK